MVHQFPGNYIQHFDEFSDLVFLETGRVDSENYRSWFFANPVAVLRIEQLAEMPWLFGEIEKHLSRNHYLAGYFTYECGAHFEPHSHSHKRTVHGCAPAHGCAQDAGWKPSQHPLAWFGVYDAPAVFNHYTGEWDRDFPKPFSSGTKSSPEIEPKIEDLHLEISNGRYQQAVNRIKDYILAGDVYQVNLTAKSHFRYNGSSATLYDSLRARQPVSYAAYIKTDDLTVLSFSPELFFRRDGSRIMAKPMKGTMARGKTLAEDERMAEQLWQDPKNRAENLMIVDLLRNDLGRIAITGSVQVPQVFTIEKYQTLFQMTSTITATLPPEMSYYEIFRSLFPCGSVTGAPKVRAMEIINELENGPRGVYTGAIGYFAPQNRAVFNVPIRTVVLSDQQGEMGVGSGIVYDSGPEAEFLECRLKMNFFTVKQPDFQLIETLLWDGQYPFLAKHALRLQSSAAYFDFPLSMDEFMEVLRESAETFQEGRKYKVRLTLDKKGRIHITSQEIAGDKDSGTRYIKVSGTQTDSNDLFLYHKTTIRSLYNQEFQEAMQKGATDVIFTNERHEITEGAISNVIIEREGRLITPPVNCGLLNGVYRMHLLETNQAMVEQVITEDDMRNAEHIYICNAVRGLRKVALID